MDQIVYISHLPRLLWGIVHSGGFFSFLLFLPWIFVYIFVSFYQGTSPPSRAKFCIARGSRKDAVGIDHVLAIHT